MTKLSTTQSQKRFSESIGQLFDSKSKPTTIFLKSSTDQGVIRNGGRNGSRFAPKSLLTFFKRLTYTPKLKHLHFQELEVANEFEEKSNFKEAQLKQSERIKKVFEQNPDAQFIHLGGGHDHIYPLLLAFADKYKSICVINIDAHADTRTDEESHSGTPFRQFAKSFDGQFLLAQIGLHHFANSSSTLSSIDNCEQKILWRNDLRERIKINDFFKDLTLKISQETLIVISLDADAFSSSDVPGVSAVNHDGISLSEFMQIMEMLKPIINEYQTHFGVYELNPVYDSISGTSMRTISSVLFEFLKINHQ